MQRIVRNAGLAVILLSVAIILGSTPALAATTFRVAVPGSTPPGDLVYVAGNFQGWNPGSPAHALALQPDGRWTITLALAPGQPIQFKFTRGTWETVEKGSVGEEIPDRALTPQDGVTYDFTVATWRDLGTITGHLGSFTHAPFLAGRRCWVYLPPGYGETDRRYPVLYMHDGQNLFDVRTSFAGEWRVDEACEALIGAGEIEPVIVVGIENGQAQRCFEYTPWNYPGAPCTGGGGDAYLAAIRDVLIDEVDARYLTRTGPAHTFLCGSSLGGLISAYAGYAYDQTFGRVASVSPSYWWDGGHMISYAQAQGRPDLERFYQDMGTVETGSMVDGNGNGIDDSIEMLRAMSDVAVAQGFQLGADFLSIEAAGHTHNEFYWSQRFPDLLRFLIGPPLTGAPEPEVGRPLELAVWPNPALAVSRVEFSLAEPGRVLLEIVDLAGRRIGVIAEGELPAGRHTRFWNRAATGGRDLVAGVYWLRLTTASRSAVRKVVISE